MFYFRWKGKTSGIDAANEDGSSGRLVNDDHKHPNCRMKETEVDGSPHLWQFALTDFKERDELTYNYGVTDWPWRSKIMEEDTVESNGQEKQQSSVYTFSGS